MLQQLHGGPAAAVAPVTVDDKAVATLIARAALVGVALVRSTDDHDRPVFVASRWGLTKQLGSTEEVEAFLKLVGGPSA